MDHVTYGLDLIKVKYYLATFISHRHCGSEDIVILVCHVILQNHVLKEPCDFIGTSLSK